MPRKLSKKRVQMNNTKGGAKSYRKIKSRKLKRGGAAEEGRPTAAEVEPVEEPPAVGADVVRADVVRADAARPAPRQPVAPVAPVVGTAAPGAGGEGEGTDAAPPAPRKAGLGDKITGLFKKTKTPEQNLKIAIDIIHKVVLFGLPETLELIKAAMDAMPDFVLNGDAKTQYETLVSKYPGLLQNEEGDLEI